MGQAAGGRDAGDAAPRRVHDGHGWQGRGTDPLAAADLNISATSNRGCSRPKEARARKRSVRRIGREQAGPLQSGEAERSAHDREHDAHNAEVSHGSTPMVVAPRLKSCAADVLMTA